MPDWRSHPFAADFRVHELHTRSEAAARVDFGEMIGHLVDALYPQAREPGTRPPCGGPGPAQRDAVCRQYDGRLVIWQTRYLLPRVGDAYLPQIRASYLRARVHAREHGGSLGRWVLCVPGLLDPRLARWWEQWRREQRVATGTDIDLWDAPALRTRLGRPVAKLVRAGYYCRPGAPQFGWAQPSDGADAEGGAAAAARAFPPGGAGEPWRGGATVRMAGRSCVLDGDPVERRGGEGAWLLREGAASLVGTTPRPVWFRQVLVRRPGDRADAQLAAVDGQLRLLAEIGGRSGLPALVAGHVTPAEGVLLSARPPGRTWREVFGPPAPQRRRSARPPAPPAGLARHRPGGTTIALLRAAAGAGDALAALHESGHSHRAVTPDAVVLPPVWGSRAAGASILRDLGLATVTRRAGEGPAEYRAPEQELFGLHGPRVGLRTDVFRLAAMAYHTLSGVMPTCGGPAPLRGLRLPFPVPQTLDEVLLRALDLDPARRPARIRVLADAFRLGALHLTQASR